MPISTCAVTGNVKNLLNSNVQNCTLRASVLTPFFHGQAWISGELTTTTTDASGNFSLSVIETETIGKKITFTFEYNDGSGAIKRRAYTVIVPDTATVTLADLVVADDSPVTANTFPASSVTVVPTGNLAADDVQDALTELQTDIDALSTLADGKIYIGNASNVATEVTPAGDVTISSAGATAIGAGVIVNADINSSAAIAYSKLDLAGTIVNADVATAAAIAHSKLANITAGSVLMGNGSNVPTATVVTGDVTINSSGVTAIAGGVIVNADINSSAAIVYSKLDLNGSVTNADITGGAAIARTKLASGTNYRVLANNSSGVMSENAALTANHVVTADANGQLTGVAPGTSGNVLTSNGTTWASTTPASTALVFTSQSSTFTASVAYDIYYLDGASFTVDLPTAVGNGGKVFTFAHNDPTAGRVYTIDGNSSETIDGATTKKISLYYESLKIVSDGSNWRILERRIPSAWTTFTPTGSWSTNTTYTGKFRRVGENIDVQVLISLAGAPTSANLTVNIPNSSSWTIDTNNLISTSGENGTFGSVTILDSGTANYTAGSVNYSSTTAVTIRYAYNPATTQINSDVVNQAAPVTFASGDLLFIRYNVPITDWEG